MDLRDLPQSRPLLPLHDVPAMDRRPLRDLGLVRARRRAVDRETVGFRSSPRAVRTHCGACGAPLYLAYDARNDVALTVGTFDTPEAVHPTHHYGAESRLAWGDIGPALPAKPTRERW